MTVVLTLSNRPNAITVPSQAVQSGQQGPYLFVVKADKTVEMRLVKLGQLYKNQLVVEQGVTPGETVVTDGHVRLCRAPRLNSSRPKVRKPRPMARRKNGHDCSRDFHQTAGHDHAAHGGDSDLRIAGHRLLPVSDLPNVDFPTIMVSVTQPGASPETMASAVALPLEKQFSTIAGIDQMTSTSYLGSTGITLQFSLSRNIDAAAQDVQAMITKAQRDLPNNLPIRPRSRRLIRPTSRCLIAPYSPTMRLSDVDEYAETTVAQRISMIRRRCPG